MVSKGVNSNRDQAQIKTVINELNKIQSQVRIKMIEGGKAFEKTIKSDINNKLLMRY